MIAEFFVLTLFLCPSTVKQCTPNELEPVRTIRYEYFSDCENTGKTLKDIGEFDDYKCHRHER